jgi:hypothetical protein
MRHSINKYVQILVLLACGFLTTAEAKIAPSDMTEFNKECPAPKLCGSLSKLVDSCRQQKKHSCSDFVEGFKKLLPEYDCQRPFDATDKVKHIVPALWLCESREDFLNFLSKLTARNAREVFGSKELREALDGAGALAEEYIPKSLATEKTLRKK